MLLQNLNKNYGKTNKEYAEGMQNTTKNEDLLLEHVNRYHCISQNMKQQKEQIMANSLELSEVRIFIYGDEHTKVFMNYIERTGSMYTKF